MVASEKQAHKRSDIEGEAFAACLNRAIEIALAKPGVRLSVERAHVDEQWLRGQVRSARFRLSEATREALDRYVDRYLTYVAIYDEGPFSPNPTVAPLAGGDREIIRQWRWLWTQSLALAAEEEISERIEDWLRDRPGNLALEPERGSNIHPGTAAIAETADARRFREVCADNPVGAIGLAGPRGCGKTTLLTRGLDSRIPARDKVRVTVAAPVRYESRDFLLHLFAEICRNVVRQRYPSYWHRFPSIRSRFPMRSIRRITSFSVLMYLGALIVSKAWLNGLGEPFRNARELFGELWPWLWLPFGDSKFHYVTPESVSTVLLCGSTVAAYLAVHRALIWIVVTRRDTNVPPVVRLARRHLETIRTLQTAATVGISSQIGVGGAKLAVSRSVERAARAWSFPELISEMKEFLGEVTGVDVGHNDHHGYNALTEYNPFGVVLVIDELDKVDSVEDVQRFINEIKGMFDAPGTQVLISISEDALAAFELRGLPVRDAFDSAFQHVVRVGYLSIADTRRVLERLDLPALSRPFVWLVYCMSGGLPRDVTRVGRELQAVARARPGERLATVCQYLIGQDIRRRLPAFEQACGDLLRAAVPGSEQPILELVREIRRIAAFRGPYQTANLLSTVPALLAAEGVGGLGKQTGCFLYYCATVLDILVIDELTAADEERYKRLLPALVEGRQAMAVHPDLTVELIDEFRRAWNLPLLASDASA